METFIYGIRNWSSVINGGNLQGPASFFYGVRFIGRLCAKSFREFSALNPLRVIKLVRD